MSRKSLYIIILCTIFCHTLSAQTYLHGRIMELSDNHERIPLANVTIIVEGAGGTVSDNDGHFKLTFNRLKEGDRVSVRKIDKKGYELVSSYFLDQWYISPSDTMVITMVQQEKFKELRDQFCCLNSPSYRDNQLRDERRERLFNDSCNRVIQFYRDSLTQMEEQQRIRMNTVAPFLLQFSIANQKEILAIDDVDQLVQFIKYEQAQADTLEAISKRIK